ncbi:hypothetical protein DFS34DRAFT_76022 [Phlyctochytrium arcticum]|nr:hypothetical protein DFS34DRAFT_76022 [Phlyctochytrium arcticum]
MPSPPSSPAHRPHEPGALSRPASPSQVHPQRKCDIIYSGSRSSDLSSDENNQMQLSRTPELAPAASRSDHMSMSGSDSDGDYSDSTGRGSPLSDTLERRGQDAQNRDHQKPQRNHHRRTTSVMAMDFLLNDQSKPSATAQAAPATPPVITLPLPAPLTAAESPDSYKLNLPTVSSSFLPSNRPTHSHTRSYSHSISHYPSHAPQVQHIQAPFDFQPQYHDQNHRHHRRSLSFPPSVSGGSPVQNSDNETILDTMGRVKTRRKRASPDQLAALNKVFTQTFFPSTELRYRLARDLGMTPRAVQIWFQNRRQNWRSRQGLPNGQGLQLGEVAAGVVVHAGIQDIDYPSEFIGGHQNDSEAGPRQQQRDHGAFHPPFRGHSRSASASWVPHTYSYGEKSNPPPQQYAIMASSPPQHHIGPQRSHEHCAAPPPHIDTTRGHQRPHYQSHARHQSMPHHPLPPHRELPSHPPPHFQDRAEPSRHGFAPHYIYPSQPYPHDLAHREVRI